MRNFLVVAVATLALAAPAGATSALDAAASWRKRCGIGCGLSYSEPEWRAECVARCAIGDEEVPEWHTPVAADEQKTQ